MYKDMRIILINGTPGAGKDTAANHLAETTPNSMVVKFAGPIKRAATAIYCSGDRDLFNRFDTFEEKSVPHSQFLGMTCRQVQIDISEKFLKLQHGDTVFGKLLATDIKHLYDGGVRNFFVSDSGFVPEAEEIARHFGQGCMTLIRVHREGHTFDGDSRDYIDLSHLPVDSYDVLNETGKQEEFFEVLKTVLQLGE